MGGQYYLKLSTDESAKATTVNLPTVNKNRTDLKEIGINTRNWVDSGQNRDYWRALVKTALKL